MRSSKRTKQEVGFLEGQLELWFLTLNSTAKMEGDHSRHRINATLMPNYQGKQVCLLGKAKDVSVFYQSVLIKKT